MRHQLASLQQLHRVFRCFTGMHVKMQCMQLQLSCPVCPRAQSILHVFKGCLGIDHSCRQLLRPPLSPCSQASCGCCMLHQLVSDTASKSDTTSSTYPGGTLCDLVVLPSSCLLHSALKYMAAKTVTRTSGLAACVLAPAAFVCCCGSWNSLLTLSRLALCIRCCGLLNFPPT